MGLTKGNELLTLKIEGFIINPLVFMRFDKVYNGNKYVYMYN